MPGLDPGISGRPARDPRIKSGDDALYRDYRNGSRIET
jgi:hypothetical protein